MAEETSTWKSAKPTQKEKDNWNYLIEECWVKIERYNADKDEYEEYWWPSDAELKAIGWDYIN